MSDERERQSESPPPPPAAPESAPPRSDAGAAEPDALVCDLCGGLMYERHCRIICPTCGYQRDCSDP